MGSFIKLHTPKGHVAFVEKDDIRRVEQCSNKRAEVYLRNGATIEISADDLDRLETILEVGDKHVLGAAVSGA